jgi:hypothetical protein
LTGSISCLPGLFLAESPKNQDASAHQGQAARVAGSRCGSAFAFIANKVYYEPSAEKVWKRVRFFGEVVLTADYPIDKKEKPIDIGMKMAMNQAYEAARFHALFARCKNLRKVFLLDGLQVVGE